MYFTVRLIAFTVFIGLYQVIFENVFMLLSILYSSFHLESLDLLSYFVLLFLSFSLVSFGYDFP